MLNIFSFVYLFIQSFCPFFQLDCFLLLSFRNSLYILYINSLSYLLFGNIFSHSVDFLFILLVESFNVYNFSLTHTLIQSHQPSLGCELPGWFHAFLFLLTPISPPARQHKAKNRGVQPTLLGVCPLLNQEDFQLSLAWFILQD